MKKIAIACDHAGFEYKEIIKKHFADRCDIQDFGTDSPESVDYPDFVHPAADSVESGVNILGILICAVETVYRCLRTSIKTSGVPYAGCRNWLSWPENIIMPI